MTHIGCICAYNDITGNGILMDSHRFLHAFTISSCTKFYVEQFVTYQGEGEIVKEITPFEDYSISTVYESNGKQYIQNGNIRGLSNNFLIDNSGIRYKLSGAEDFIVRRILQHQSLNVQDYNQITLEDYAAKIDEIVKSVDYVSSHINDIANSYEVTINVTHISKIGGDDRFYTKRHVNLLYRDSYINHFFLTDATLDKESGYSSHYVSPYKLGRQIDEENKAKDRFIKEYNKNAHLTNLLYDCLNQILAEKDAIEKDNRCFSLYWGNLDLEISFYTVLWECQLYIKYCNMSFSSNNNFLPPEHKRLSTLIDTFNNGMQRV